MNKVSIRFFWATLLILLATTLAFARNPVIFVHGYTASARSYETILKSLAEDYGWTYGGELAVDYFTREIKMGYAAYPSLPQLRPGDFYLMDFSDYQHPFPSQTLSLQEQGEELQKIVQKVLELTGKPQVILVGHSMGVLSVRAYLQFFRAANVEQAILIAGPNLGSETALLADQGGFAKFVSLFFRKDIDPKSKALDILKPGSQELSRLNDFFHYPLPKNTRVSCLIIEGGNIPFLPPNFPEDNDGLVTVKSQDLTSVFGALESSSEEILRFVFRIPSLYLIIPTRFWGFGIPLAELAHSRAIHTPMIINTIVRIIDGTYPHAKIPPQSRMVRIGEGYTVNLEHALPQMPVSLKLWRLGQKLWVDPQPLGTTTPSGQYAFATKALEEPGYLDVQFTVGEAVSNVARVQIQSQQAPRLELSALRPHEGKNYVLADITGAEPRAKVTLKARLSSGSELELIDAGLTNVWGGFQTLLILDRTETFLQARALVDGKWSNSVGFNLAPPRRLFSLDRDFLATHIQTSGVKLDRPAPDYQLSYLGEQPVATFAFLEKTVVYLTGEIEAKTDLIILLTPEEGGERELTRLTRGEKKALLIREPAGVSQIRFLAGGSGSPLWILRKLFTASSVSPPFLSAGFDRDPIPKGERYGNGFWRNWISLSEPEEAVPLRLLRLEFTFFDATGKPFWTQVETAENLLKKKWFWPDIFSPSPFGPCAAVQPDGEGNLWFMGPGAICQELVYDLKEQTATPWFVQLRFQVQDLFGSRQTVTKTVVMLPQ